MTFFPDLRRTLLKHFPDFGAKNDQKSRQKWSKNWPHFGTPISSLGSLKWVQKSTKNRLFVTRWAFLSSRKRQKWVKKCVLGPPPNFVPGNSPPHHWKSTILAWNWRKSVSSASFRQNLPSQNMQKCAKMVKNTLIHATLSRRKNCKNVQKCVKLETWQQQLPYWKLRLLVPYSVDQSNTKKVFACSSF